MYHDPVELNDWTLTTIGCEPCVRNRTDTDTFTHTVCLSRGVPAPLSDVCLLTVTDYSTHTRVYRQVVYGVHVLPVRHRGERMEGAWGEHAQGTHEADTQHMGAGRTGATGLQARLDNRTFLSMLVLHA